jgi:nucleotide-binding universal stress UspA family protein
MRLWKTILHPTDFSEASEAAFAEARRLAGASDAELVLLHVLTPPSAYELQGFEWGALHLPDEAARRHSAAVELGRLVGRAKRRGVRGRAMLVEGVPNREILRIAASIPVDLVVMGTHGRHGLDRLLFGSTASRVVRGARCPVLTVRAPANGHRPHAASARSRSNRQTVAA